MTEKERVETYWPRPVVERLKRHLEIERAKSRNKLPLPVALEGGCQLYYLAAAIESLSR